MTGNHTSEDVTGFITNGQKIAMSLAFGLTMFVGLCGNALVVYIFGWRKRRGSKTSEFFLMSLGITDLMVCAFVPPWMIYSTASINKTPSVAACLAGPLGVTTAVTVSQMLLIIICYDRYRAIVTPMKESVCRGLVVTGVVVGILLAFAISIPPIIRSVEGHAVSKCYDYSYRTTLGLLHAIAHLGRDVISFSVMAYFIRKMLIALKEHAKFRKAAAINRSNDEEFQRTKKILYLVLVFFAISIWPTDITYLAVNVYFFTKTTTGGSNQFVFIVLVGSMVLQVLNSCVNVFIYSAIHPEFKKMWNNMWNSTTNLFQKKSKASLGTSNSVVQLSTGI